MFKLKLRFIIEINYRDNEVKYRRMNRDVDKMYKCYETLREMLKDRGYLEDEEDSLTKRQIKYATDVNHMKKALKDYTKNPLHALKKLQMLRHHAMFDRSIYVFFVNCKIGVTTIKHYTTLMEKHVPPVNHCILVSVVSDAVLTPFAVGAINALQSNEGKIVEHFYLSDLLINITKHELQPPKIEICTQEEKDEVLSGYKLKESQLHWIVNTDPLAKYFGLQPRDVLKITRYSETTGKSSFYRICVEDESV